MVQHCLVLGIVVVHSLLHAVQTHTTGVASVEVLPSEADKKETFSFQERKRANIGHVGNTSHSHNSGIAGKSLPTANATSALLRQIVRRKLNKDANPGMSKSKVALQRAVASSSSQFSRLLKNPAISANGVWKYTIPPIWETFCAPSVGLVKGSNFTAAEAIHVQCTLRNDHILALEEFDHWIRQHENHVQKNTMPNQIVRYAIDIVCAAGARMSVTWPVKVKHLWMLRVNGCIIQDWITKSSAGSFIGQSSTESLKVIEIIDSNIFYDIHNLLQEPKDRLLEEDIQCGPINLERFVFRNVTRILYGNPNPNSDWEKTLTRLNHEMSTKRVVCEYPKLLYLDESQTFSSRIQSDNISSLTFSKFESIKKTSKFSEIAFLVPIKKYTAKYLDFKFPSLRYYNLSHTGITYLPSMILQWKALFPFMKYMDISYNGISSITGFSDHTLSGTPDSIIDMSHNHFSKITKYLIKDIRSKIKNSTFLDLRGNKLSCDCELEHFYGFLKSNVLLRKKHLNKYAYLYDLRCKSPPELRYRTVSELSKQDLGCQKAETTDMYYLPPLIVMCSFAVVCLVGIVVIIKYRKEISILAFTRLNVILPCQKLEHQGKKPFDAFIAYSSEDTGWVMRTFLPLEREGNEGPGFQLILNDRDFKVGASISENILHSVQSSRHTVLVLSKAFLKSEWCLLEFRTSFQQSLFERKRHLIMILRENIPNEELGEDLRRCMKTLTYLKADDKLFWDKLVYAIAEKR